MWMQACSIVWTLLTLCEEVRGDTCRIRCENRDCTTYKMSVGELTCIVEQGIAGPIKSKVLQMKQYHDRSKTVTCGTLSESGKRIFILSATNHMIYQWNIDSQEMRLFSKLSKTKSAFDLVYVKSTNRLLVAYRNQVQSYPMVGRVSKVFMLNISTSAMAVDDRMKLIFMAKRESPEIVVANENGRYVRNMIILRTFVSDLTLDTKMKLIYLGRVGSKLLIVNYNGQVIEFVNDYVITCLHYNVEKNILYFTHGVHVLAKSGKSVVRLTETRPEQIKGVLSYQNLIYVTHSHRFGAVKDKTYKRLTSIRIGRKKHGDGRMCLFH